MSEVDLPPAAVVLTQVAVVEGLAAACALSKVPVDAVPTVIGAMAVCRRTGAGEPERAAEAVSRTLANTRVVLITQRDGQLSAGRWSGGRHVETLAPGLLLDGAPPEIERVLLGQVSGADLPGAVSSAGMSRWRAVRTLASVARAGRRR